MRNRSTSRKWVAWGLGLGFLLASSAFADGPKFPEKYADFEKLTFAQMKALPDLKAPLDRPVSPADLAGRSETELVLLRNSIYAQHGLGFGQKALANYFLGRSWYKKDFEAFDLEKLPKTARANVSAYLKAQAAAAGAVRGVASEENAYETSQIAYNLFLMGFCTYDVESAKQAGMIVFAPGGTAKVFHSRASRIGVADYAYEEYAKPEMADLYGSLLIDAKWAIEFKTVGKAKKGIVTVSFPKETVTRILENQKPVLDETKRQVLVVNYPADGGYVPNLYPWTKTKKCTMTKLK